MFSSCVSGCRCLKLTCGHFPVSRGGPIRDDALDLEELVRLVASNNGEAKAHVALLERCGQETAFQLSGVPREEGLLYNGHKQRQIKRHECCHCVCFMATVAKDLKAGAGQCSQGGGIR